jgi:hypothetical protein
MKKTIIISASIVVSLATLLGSWFMVQPSGPAYAAGALYRQAHLSGDSEGFRHHGKFRGHRAVARLCSDRRDRSIDAVTGFVEGFVNLTPEQIGPWKNLTQAVTEGSAMVGKACEDVKLKAKALPAPQKLEQVETLLETGLSIVQKVRPAVAEFYGVLSDTQKKALDQLIAHRHHKSHH